ncbi:tetratricopeptide repeat protein [Streptomyces anulatus]|uniref:tetratricopeptide repeat protein n=1 Tax=Streptomyces anulatus TaxID=1892 RepID=UPI00371565FA
MAQAAAYIIDADLTCTSFRDLLADRIRKLADLLPEPAALPDDQTATVAATWSLSIERANQLRPAGLARPMLEIAAMLDPSGIPNSVLTSDSALDHLTANRSTENRTATQVTAQDAEGALRALHRLSLIDYTPGTPHQAVRVHQLIQRATRDDCPSGQRVRVALAAAEALIDVWPDNEPDAAVAQALRSNTDALNRHAEGDLFQTDSGLLPAVLFRAGQSLGASGQLTAAIHYFQLLFDAICRYWGADHEAALTSRLILAVWRGKAGDVAGAAAATAELLVDRERVLGSDHRDTLSTRNNLAMWQGTAGEVASAVAALSELLADQERVLGADHPDTLATRHNLGMWQEELGDRVGANAAYAELLDNQERVLGADHPHTFRTRYNLANRRGRAGDAVGAAAALKLPRDLGHSMVMPRGCAVGGSRSG